MCSPRPAFLLLFRREAKRDKIVAIAARLEANERGRGRLRRARNGEAIHRRCAWTSLFFEIDVPPFHKSILTSGRDKLLGLLDGLDGPAELLPRGELLAGGRHSWKDGSSWWWVEKKGGKQKEVLSLS
jgi:hypothetical protein